MDGEGLTWLETEHPNASIVVQANSAKPQNKAANPQHVKTVVKITYNLVRYLLTLTIPENKNLKTPAHPVNVFIGNKTKVLLVHANPHGQGLP